MKRVIIKIYGKVQGVFYRQKTQEKARGLNLTGWIRNESDGTVTIVAEGIEENLKELIKWCYNGPNRAKVEKVKAEWKEAIGEFNEFTIKYS